MLILSNALSNVADEGCVKVAKNLVKGIKQNKNALVVAFDRRSDLADKYITVNKLLLNRNLIKIVKEHKGEVLYIPFPAKPISTAVRIFILSLFAGKNFKVVMSMTTKTGFISRELLKISHAKFVVFSNSAFCFYKKFIGKDRVSYLKTGVNTKKFMPVSKEESAQLKQKYGFDTEKKLILHVGHLKSGRNVMELKKISPEHQVLLVTSTLTKDEQDIYIKHELLKCPNIKIIDTFVPNIEEIYQMADVYFFPVIMDGNCIDVPLSCLEAAACNKPIVTTDFGEMSEFKGKNGFCFVDSFDTLEINRKINEVLDISQVDTRSAVVDYDWKFAVAGLEN